MTQRLVGEFDQLLQSWPVLVEAARVLRARSVRLAQMVWQ
jgi:hypothetical protein